ncbi:MAG: ATPase domain-containing protein [Sulfuritalea sp.]|nr:ATPase domain-containing protein [Sulfuritalea sp.]
MRDAKAVVESMVLPGTTIMTSARASAARLAVKASTGIAGFDEITGGGLPRARTTLLVGGPGSGKTIFGLQFLAQGVQECKKPGISRASSASDRL